MKFSLTRSLANHRILTASAASLLVGVLTANGQIVLDSIGVPFLETFTGAPAATNWSRSDAGFGTASATITSTLTTADNRVNGTVGTGVTISNTKTGLSAGAAAVVTSNFSDHYSTIGAVGGGATGVDATVLMARLFNNTGTPITSLTLGWDLTLHNNSVITVEDAFAGHRLYWSLNGTSWTAVGNFGFVTPAAGGPPTATVPQSTTVPFGVWPVGAPAYLIWLDDNSVGNPDGLYTLDNVNFSPVGGLPSTYNLAHGLAGSPNGTLEAVGANYWLASGSAARYYAGTNAIFSQAGTASIDVPANISVSALQVTAASGTYTIGGAGQIAGPLEKSGAGTLALTSANAFTTVSFNGGTIEVSAAGALGAGTITVGASGGTLRTPAAYTLGNALTGAGRLTTLGPETLTISGVNTHAATTISADSAILSGSLAINHNLIVSAGASLRVSGTVGTGSTITNSGRIFGTGTINGTTTVSNGGTIESGTGGTGTLSFQNLTFGSAAGNTAVFDSSLSGIVNVTGNLVLNGGAGNVTVNVSGNPGGFPLPHTFTLLDYAAISGAGYGGFVLGTKPNRVEGVLVDNTANTRVDFRLTAFDFPIWSGALGSNWVIGSQGGSENWLKSSDLSSTTFIPTDTVVFGDQPSTDQTVTINTADVTVASLTFTNATRNYTFGGTRAIAGNAALVKSGAATVTINNTNSFTGSVAVNGGTISVPTLADGGVNSPLGSGSAVTLDGGGTLEVTAAVPVSTNRSLTINNTLGPGGTIRTNGTVSISGAISGSGTLVKTGTGRVIVKGVASGTSTVSQGVLEFGTGANFSGNVTNDGTIEITNGAVIAGTINNNTTVKINRTDTATITPTITGPGGLDMIGGPLALVTLGGGAAANTFTGLTRVLSGTLVAGKTTGTNAISGNLLLDGGNFRYAGNANGNQIANTASITINSGNFGEVNAVGVSPVSPGPAETVATATINGGYFSSGTATFTTTGLFRVTGGSPLVARGGVISAGSVEVTGGVFNFDGGSPIGANAAGVQDSRLAVGVGGINVTNGTFNFNAGPSPFTASTSPTTGSRGSRLLLNGNFTSSGTTNILRAPGSLALIAQARSAIELNSAVRTFDVTGTLNLGTVAAPLSVRDGNPQVVGTDPIPAPGGIIKAGTGILNMPGDQPYRGTTTINGGTLAIDGALSTSGVTINNGGTLRGKGSTLGGSTVNSGGAIIVGVAGSGALSFPTLTLGSAPGDTSSLTVTRSATAGIINVVNSNGLIANGGANSVTVNLTGIMPGLGRHVLIDYAGTLGGTGISAFKKGTLPARVLTADIENDATNTAVVLNILSAEFPVWTGRQTTEWSTAVIPVQKNWGLVGMAGTTDFIPLDNVIFDDTATNTLVELSGGDIAPNIIRFNNTLQTYQVTGAGAITGAATIIKDGLEEVTITGAHSFTGAVTLNAGTLIVPTIENSGTNSPLGAGNAVAFNGGALKVNSGVTDRTLTLSSSNGTILTDGTFTVAGPITGAGNLSKAGFGTAIFTGAKTGFNSGLMLKGGTIQFSTVDALGGASQTVTLDGGALEYTAATALDWGAAAQTRAINSLSGGVIRVTQGGPTAGLQLTRAGSLTGAGPIVKEGLGPLRIVGNNVGLTADWTIAEGAIEAQSANALGSGSITLNRDIPSGKFGILVKQQAATAAAGTTLPNNITLNGGTLQVRSGNFGAFGGTVDVVAPSVASLRSFSPTTDSHDITIAGPVTGSEPLTVQGNLDNTTTALILTNSANTYSGQFIVNTAQGLAAQPLTTGNPFGTASIALTDARLRIRDNGTGINGTIAYGNNVSIGGTATSIIDVARGSGANTGNTVRLGSLTMTTLQLEVAGANGYGVEFSGPNDLGPSPTITANTANITLSGDTTSAFGLYKYGAGTLKFSGTGTATINGNVSIQGGTVFVNNTLADTSNVEVAFGTLSGSGTVAGSVSVTAATGNIAPGNSTGILSVGGSVALIAGSGFNVELTHVSQGVPVAGTDYDQLSVGTGPLDGTVDITDANLNIATGTGLRAGDLFFIIVNDGVDAVTGTFANVAAAGTPFTVNGVQFEISYDANFETNSLHGGNDVALVVPEPGSAVLLLGSLVVLAGRRRRTA